MQVPAGWSTRAQSSQNRRAGTSTPPSPPPPRVPADAYKVTEESTVVLAAPVPPLIKLDDKHYK